MATSTPDGRDRGAGAPTGPRRRNARPTDAAKQPSRAKAREGKKALVGYFSERLNGTMHGLADREERSMQSLIGEAVDLLLVARGMEPLDER